MAGPMLAGMMDMPTSQPISPSFVNSFRISAVIDRLRVHLRGGSNNDNTELFNLCLSLARGIDYAVANNEITARASELPFLLKQVCQRKNDNPLLKAGTMVLMISVKSACRNGWFSEKENEELHLLSNEMRNSFCSTKDMNSEKSTFHLTISMIISRFYPGMKMGEILASVEATPGYGAFVIDFHISKNARSSPDDKIYLFVAQTDNTETSSCIISPQQVNFLLNGKAVDKRTCVSKDSGPQAPTPVTQMLKYGTNLLQAVGQFDGKYIIVVSFMSVVSDPSPSTILDYVPPTAALPDPDNEIVEGPSRISLNCPISFTRIKIPVKGHLCKHLQCFDFDNYVGINSRRPSWRCPHCSQSVCFTDIRIDQSMVKVLKEVGPGISHVKISADGSWEAVTESNDHADKQNEKTLFHQESTISQNMDEDILDLTEENNEIYTNNRHQDDCKPNLKNSTPIAMDTNNVQRNTPPHMEDEFWRDMYSSVLETDTVASALNREIEGIQRSESQISASNNMQLEQYNNSNNNGSGNARSPIIARLVKRVPIAVQALPAQTSAAPSSGDRQQQFSRSNLNQRQPVRTASVPPSQHVSSQNWGQQDRSHISSQRAQQLGAQSASPQQRSGYPYVLSFQANRLNNSQQQQSPIQRNPNMMRPSGQPYPPPHYTMATAQQTMNRRIPSGSSVPVPSMPEQRDPRVAENPTDPSADQIWRPSGRMRGSLSGRAYEDALSQFMIQPTQPVQAARPPVLNVPRPVVPPHLQALMAQNNFNGQASQDGSSGPGLDSGLAGGGPEK